MENVIEKIENKLFLVYWVKPGFDLTHICFIFYTSRSSRKFRILKFFGFVNYGVLIVCYFFVNELCNNFFVLDLTFSYFHLQYSINNIPFPNFEFLSQTVSVKIDLLKEFFIDKNFILKIIIFLIKTKF